MDEDLEKQSQDIKTIISPAIAHAGLSVIDDEVDGLLVDDILDAVVKYIYKADILVIDANCYEANGTFQFSPYLYYYMAVGHFRGNATILVTNTKVHLPDNLLTYHTLTYSRSEVGAFMDKFRATADEIRLQRNSHPDNPVQDYFTREDLAEERRQIAEREAEKKRQNQSRQPVIFRPVEPCEE